MNDEQRNWKVAHLDEIERRGRDIPVREHLGIHSFGINGFNRGDDGTLINEHDEAGSGQEELYSWSTARRRSRSTARRRCAARDAPIRGARGAAEGDRERNHPRYGRHARRGVSGGRLG